MGSSSDWETMKHAVEILERFSVPFERHIVSAHRTPVWMAEFASGAEARGVEVIIAGAGGAAHLPGMVAAHTVVPVLGVPVQSAALQGLDSLLSIAQMPGGVPVGTLAIGKPGAINAGLLAVSILSNSRPDAADQASRVSRRADRESPPGTAAVNRVIAPGAALGVLGGGQLGRMFAIAARRMGYRVHVFSPDDDSPSGQIADRRSDRAVRRSRRAARVRGRRRGGHLRVRERAGRSDRRRARRWRRCARRRWRCTRRSSARARRPFSPITGFPRRPSRPRPRSTSCGTRSRGSARRPSSRPRRSATTARASTRSRRPADVEHIWTAIGHQEAVVEKFISLQAEILDRRRARRSTASRAVSALREPPSEPHPRPHDRAGGHCARGGGPGGRRSRGRFSRNCSTSACCAWSSSSAPTASCS